MGFSKIEDYIYHNVFLWTNPMMHSWCITEPLFLVANQEIFLKKEILLSFRSATTNGTIALIYKTQQLWKIADSLWNYMISFEDGFYLLLTYLQEPGMCFTRTSYPVQYKSVCAKQNVWNTEPYF